MERAARVLVSTHDIAAAVDTLGHGTESAREVDRHKSTVLASVPFVRSEQKPMHVLETFSEKYRTWRRVAVRAHDVVNNGALICTVHVAPPSEVVITVLTSPTAIIVLAFSADTP
jgi:hypothetical protein